MARRALTACLVVLMIIGGATVLPVNAQRAQSSPVPGVCQADTSTADRLPGGARWMVCIPSSGWNGDLVVWAHGYTSPNAPLDFQNLNFNGVYLPTLVQTIGYAFATTSYRKNGLAILEGVDDVTELVAKFDSVATGEGLPAPVHTYMVGASEGGIVTTLLIERHPELFSGGLAMCGPIGDFGRQLDYWGNFRVLFNYFFPGIIPSSTITVPQTVIDNWDSTYKPMVQSAVTVSPTLTQQLMRTAKAPINPFQPLTTAVSTTLDLMWYNVFATNDGMQELGGNPFDNTHTWYYGSTNDLKLNLSVQRIAADPVAISNTVPYQTSGNLTRPLVTLHTIGDDIIPFWNEYLYSRKVHLSGAGSFIPIPVFAYGHCNFTLAEVLSAFALLALQVQGHPVAGIHPQFSPGQVRRDELRAFHAFRRSPMGY